MSEITVTPNANEIKLSVDLYKQAYSEGKTLSQYLESIDPSDKYGPNEKLDAFERQLARFGIKVNSNEAKGLYADKVEKFYTTSESKVLFPEYINRVAREALMAGDILPELVAVTTPIDSGVYRSFYISDQQTAQQKVRVSEGAELPTTELTGQENAITLRKKGRILKASYEFVRRMRIDLLAIHIRRMMQQAAVDKATDALDVIINGDGNSNAATNYNITALGGTAGTLDYKSFVKFRLKYFPGLITTLIGGENEIVQYLTLQFPNIDPLTLLAMAQNPVQNRTELPQNLFGSLRVVYLPSAPANKLVGIDRRFALEQVVEIGSDIVETDRIISSQFQEIALSEVMGFAKFDPNASKTLTLNA